MGRDNPAELRTIRRSRGNKTVKGIRATKDVPNWYGARGRSKTRYIKMGLNLKTRRMYRHALQYVNMRRQR